MQEKKRKENKLTLFATQIEKIVKTYISETARQN